MGLNKDQVREILDQQRAEAAIEKARAAQTENEALEEQARYEFQLEHNGAIAVQKGIEMWCCEANFKILEDWCRDHNDPLSLHSLNEAFKACRDQLAPVPAWAKPTQHTNLQESRVAPQPASSIVSIPKPPVHVPLRREEIIKLVNGKDGPAKLRKLIGRDPRREAAINRILAGN